MTRWYVVAALMCGVAVATNSVAAQQAPCPTPSSTFDLIQQGIFEQHGCTRDFCHGADMQAGLDLRAGTSYASLLNGQDNGDYLVQPRRPQQSVLWLVLAAKTLQLTNVGGTPMPIGATPLSSDELEGLRLWIVAGAPAHGTVARVADLINACPQGSGSDYGNLPACDPSDPTLVLPDLSPQPPTDIRLVTQGGHRILYFSTIIANNGAGPLIIQAATTPTQSGQMVDAEQVIWRKDGSKCAYPAGMMQFDKNGSSEGWEYSHVANFELRKDNPTTGDMFALRSKAYLCLLDTDAIRAANNAPYQYEPHCYDQIGRMGISAGWMDTYHRVFPGQWLDLDADPEHPAEPGSYYLVNIANPTKTLLEVDPSLDSNLSFTRVRINAPPPDGQPTPNGPSTPTMPPTPTVQPTPPGPHQHVPRPTPPLHVPRPMPSPRATPTPQPTLARHPVHPAQATRPLRPTPGHGTAQ